MEARFKLRKTEERMVADGGISGLQMVIRTLGKKDRTPRHLLAPATLSLALSQPPGSGMHVDVAISDIKITVSPGEWRIKSIKMPPKKKKIFFSQLKK